MSFIPRFTHLPFFFLVAIMKSVLFPFFAIFFAFVIVTVNAQAAGKEASNGPGPKGSAATTSTDAQAGSSDINALISALPVCFQACASQAATSTQIGCKSIMDLSCFCPKQDFITATATCITSSSENECPTMAKNTTAITEATQGFQQACAAYASTTNTTATTGAAGSKSGTSTSAMTTGEKAGTTAGTTDATATKGPENGALGLSVPSTPAVLSAGLLLALGVATML